MGLNEARAILEIGGFRCRPGYGYDDGKWFAASFEDAVRWGRAFQRFSLTRPFRVAAAWLPRNYLAEVEFHERWDAIGPAYYVREDQLPILHQAGAVTIFDSVFNAEDD
ncbi:MAG: hypothetical protein ACRDJH_10275 [Thermomicrobiales bacterium]